MPVMLGGEKAWKVYSKGDLVVSFQWVNGEPALILYPKNPASLNPGAFVLPLESAFKYADSKTGAPTRYCIQMANKAAEVMGLFPDRFILHRIVDAIMEGLLDLIEMPPEPTGLNQKQAQEIGEIVIKNGDRTVYQGAVNAPTHEELMAAND
jgi:hypothetical protein